MDLCRNGGVSIKGKFILVLIVFVVLCAPAFGQTTADDWGNKGVDLFNQGKYNESIQAFDKAIKLNPQDADAWYSKGSVLSQQGKYDEAIQAYDNAIELDPQFAEAWHNKGEALKSIGHTTEAKSAYDKANELNITTKNNSVTKAAIGSFVRNMGLLHR